MAADLMDYAEEPPAAPVSAAAPWTVLIVDDDVGVHTATRLALRRFSFHGRGLHFLSAYSAVEGRALLEAHPETALILLDVVMETEDAGLDLVQQIRDDLRNPLVRIILRTGQPGQAPEREVVARYDINDYKAKDELTATRLWTSVLTALRAYDQLHVIEAHGQAMAKVMGATARLLAERSLSGFTALLADSLRGLVGSEPVLLLVRADLMAGTPVGEPRVLGGIIPGDTAETLQGLPLCSPVLAGMRDPVMEALVQARSLQGPGWLSTHAQLTPDTALVIYVGWTMEPLALEAPLMQLFARTAMAGLEAVLLLEQLAEDRTHDRATGLLNRTGLASTLDALLVGREAATPFAVIVIDLLRFRDINQELGVAWGDRLLLLTAERLQAASSRLGPQVRCGRIGGDQFAVLLPGATLAEARHQTQTLLQALTAPVELAGKEIHPLVTPGLAWSAGRDCHAEELVARAEESLQRSKRAHGRLVEVVIGSTPEPGRLGLSIELNAALRQNQFELYYQPIVAAETRAVVAFEALVRWHHPVRGMIAPVAFIPTAEETGLIVPLGSWVIRQAALQTAAWNRDAGRRVWVSVNISAAQLAEPGFLDGVQAVIAESGVDPTLLKLEVTESTIIGAPTYAAEILSGLRDLGIRLCMDDFGTGYSNLSYLQTLPFDFLKVDRAFVQSMIDRYESRTILRTMMALAQQLDLEVVAEGVELPEQADELTRLGCQFLQGYLFGRPMPAGAAGALIAAAPGAAPLTLP
ncbi:putative bifunctional diguanylate cyclase/phosphodiesterase [Oleisolibacter albus]|uniref:putative bifunctional diguanylate cyclase/phosphodiesterase n=1 Tax=Oleisolibacter albus TaxID=2171757 RepID=UPI00138FA97A|nr:EAL domain-containing protein [Oleisolibacter albus]